MYLKALISVETFSVLSQLIIILLVNGTLSAMLNEFARKKVSEESLDREETKAALRQTSPEQSIIKSNCQLL